MGRERRGLPRREHWVTGGTYLRVGNEFSREKETTGARDGGLGNLVRSSKVAADGIRVGLRRKRSRSVSLNEEKLRMIAYPHTMLFQPPCSEESE